jgi:hypothetical protein
MIASDTVTSKYLFSYAEINIYLVSLSFFDTPLLRSVVSKKDSELRPVGARAKAGAACSISIFNIMSKKTVAQKILSTI